MELQKYITETLNFFKSKYYLENNLTAAVDFNKVINTEWTEIVHLIEQPEIKKTLVKRSLSNVINSLKEIKQKIQVSSERRLLSSLIDLLINIRREANKQLNYTEVFKSDIEKLNNISKISEKNARIFKEQRIITVRYPKVKK